MIRLIHGYDSHFNLQKPFKCDIEHRLGVSCVGGGIVKCAVSLDRGGYVPGESISVSAYVANNSKVTIKSTKAALTETIEYLARNKVVQVEKRELAVIARGKIRAGGSDKWHNESLYVPPLPPTNLLGCHLINIKYDVFVSQTKLRSSQQIKCNRIKTDLPLFWFFLFSSSSNQSQWKKKLNFSCQSP